MGRRGRRDGSEGRVGGADGGENKARQALPPNQRPNKLGKGGKEGTIWMEGEKRDGDGEWGLKEGWEKERLQNAPCTASGFGWAGARRA